MGSGGSEMSTIDEPGCITTDDLRQRIAELEFEVEALRRYGNKDCTAMADEQIAIKRAGGKCEFED